MLRFTNLSSKAAILSVGVVLSLVASSDQSAFQEIVRTAALSSGYQPPKLVLIERDTNIVDEGKQLFDSEHLSLNARITCATCHIKSKASTDGLPNAAGIHGKGEGLKRFYSGAKIVPRNTLALWGVGGKGFDTFFWDGRVDFASKNKISQFGTAVPSDDPLVTAVHLPVVEIRESIDEDDFILEQKKESVESARNVYEAIVRNLTMHETSVMESLSSDLGIPVEELTFLHVARALASFIRSEFQIRQTKFEMFMRGEESLTAKELSGAITFFGKGGCSSCHSGPYFTDLDFHSVPFPQLGFGKNGFGIDYGRYNATFNPADLYQFRTPSLLNITRTAPYGHSGSIPDLTRAVVTHFDPLSIIDLSQQSDLGRHEFYKYLARSSTANVVNFLTKSEVEDVVVFLRTLTFNKTQ